MSCRCWEVIDGRVDEVIKETGDMIQHSLVESVLSEESKVLV